jgi:hypothetical protein
MVGGGFVAVAGHVNVGGQPTTQWCSPCGCPKHPECVCDSGEEAGPCDEPVIAARGARSLPESQTEAGALGMLALCGVGLFVRLKRRG